MTILHTIFLGIIEGFTEFLPVSSTAHLTLAGSILNIPDDAFFKSFIIFIQLGAIIPVLYLYLRKHGRNMEVHKRVAAGFIPTAIIGFVLYKLIKQYFIGNIPLLLWCLAIGGAIIIIFEWLHREKETAIGSLEGISYKKAFLIGCYQAIAVIPGVSRSAATILGGLSLNIKRATIVEYSFLLAVPTMIAATGYDVLKNIHTFSSANVGTLAIGFITSLIFAQLSITFLLNFIRKHNFSWFGVYRILVAVVFVLFFLK